MQLSLQNANLQELRGDFGQVWLRLTNLSELSGSISRQEQSTALQNLSAASAQLEIKLPIENGELTFSEPVALQGLSAELQLGEPMIGTARLAAAHVAELSLRIGSIQLKLSIDATQILYERLPVGDTILYFHTLSLQKLTAKSDDFEATIEAIDLRALRVTLSQGSFQVSFPEAALEQVSARTKDLLLQTLQLSLGEVSVSKQSISLGHVSSDSLRTSFTFSPSDPSKEKRPSPPFDLRMLDGLEGKLNADIDVKVKVPVIGHRHAVHQIRLPIESGTINFVELKNNLAFLESSLIAFAVEGDELILQRDIPLIPDKPKPIIYWRLDADGQRLAGQEKILLRALFGARLAPSDEPKDEKKKSPLEHLMVRQLSLDVVLFSQEAFSMNGILPKISIEQLAVTGELHHRPELATTPTAIELKLKNLIASIFRLPIGARSLDARAVEVGALTPCTLTMNGVTPVSLSAVLSQIKLRGVSL
jgi:hypothetical protein